MIKACIFDLDGVIVDTAKYHFLAWQELAHSLNIEFTEEHNEHLKGVGRMESLEFILSLGNVDLSQEEKERLAHDKNERYVSLISGLTTSDILPGVEDFLKDLKEHNIGIALGSSSKNARPVLAYLKLDAYFDVVVDGTDITKSKPDPQVFLMGAKSLNLEPSEIVVFEDAKAGVEAALKGGFLSVGIGDEDELKAAHHVMPGFESFTFELLKNTLL